MVDFCIQARLLLADEVQQTVLERLDPQRRAAVVMALVGLGLLGVLLAVVVMLAGRWARQNRTPRSSRWDHSSDNRLQSPRQSPGLQASRGETIVDTPGEHDTKS